MINLNNNNNNNNSIIADWPISHNRTNIVDTDKQTSICYFIDVAIPCDACVKLKTTEKLDS